jgi:two-component system chemotaxis response regulator CheY
MKILCADDSNMTRKMLEDVIQPMGYDFIHARDGLEAKAQLEKHAPELVLVLLDWNIPEPNGLEILKWMRSEESMKNIPVIMLTAMGHREKVMEALEAGVNDYVTKPFEADDLRERVRQCLPERS